MRCGKWNGEPCRGVAGSGGRTIWPEDVQAYEKGPHRSDSVWSKSTATPAVFTFTHHKSLLLSAAKVKVKGYEKAAAVHCNGLLQSDLRIRYHFRLWMSTDDAEKGVENQTLFLCKVIMKKIQVCRCKWAFIFWKVSSEIWCSILQASWAAVASSTPRPIRSCVRMRWRS